MDLLQFFSFVAGCRGLQCPDFNFASVDFIKSIQLGYMYAFLAYCQDALHSSPGTRARKIVSIRQFWKYLKTKAHLIDNNIAEELETPKQPKGIVRCLTLEESVRLLIEAGSCSACDNCIITIFLNCALRLSKLAALNIGQVGSDIISLLVRETRNARYT